VVLKRGNGHALVANSLALRRAGIDQNTANPRGGSILRDRGGLPNGMLIDNAMALIERLLPPPTEADTDHALEVGGTALRPARLDPTADRRQQLPGSRAIVPAVCGGPDSTAAV